MLVATTNANESRARDNYYSYSSGNSNKPRENYNKPGDKASRTGENNYKPRESYERSDNNSFRSRENSLRTGENNYKPGENKYKPKESGSRPGDNSYLPRSNSFKPSENNYGQKEYNQKLSPAPYQRGREFPKNNFRDKDDEDDNKKVRSHKATDSKPKNQLEQQLDKLETIKRLEREKKAVQKKLREEETEKQKRPAVKQKRSSKSDWTKDYVYGLIDEDDDFLE